MTTDLVWASDNINNLTLTNTVSDTLRQLTDLCCGYDRSHAVTNKDELVYKDNNFNIIKLYNDIKTNTKLIKHMDRIGHINIFSKSIFAGFESPRPGSPSPPPGDEGR